MNNLLEISKKPIINSPKALDIYTKREDAWVLNDAKTIPKEEQKSEFSDFLSKLLEQCRRISPSFKFRQSAGSAFDQVLSKFKQSVDLYEQRYIKTIVTHQKKKSVGSIPDLSDFKEPQEDLETTKETIRNIVKYEQLLIQKENNLLGKSEKLEEDLQSFKAIKHNFEQYIQSFEADKALWLEQKKKDAEKIETEKKKILAEKQSLFKITEELKLIKKNLDCREIELLGKAKNKEDSLKRFESELEDLKNALKNQQVALQNDKLQLESEKWEISSKILRLEDQLAVVKLKQENLDEEKKEFLKEKKSFSDVKNKFEQEKLGFFSRTPSRLEQNSQSALNMSFEAIPFLSESKSLDSYYLEINEKIEKINKELENKEADLAAREEELFHMSESFKEKMNEYRLIEDSLLESKIQLEEFQNNTIIELEINTKTVFGLIIDLKKIKAELELMAERMCKELNILKRYHLDLEIIKEDPSECSPESSPRFDIKNNTFFSIESFTDKLKMIEKLSEEVGEKVIRNVENDYEYLDEKIEKINAIYSNRDL